jgi:hypothetical protein
MSTKFFILGGAEKAIFIKQYRKYSLYRREDEMKGGGLP